ncbi:MAG: hypothetical protein IKV94_03535 [Clostridia bacterium]|nr:hypothetical protein [Clostridia bacterium]
MIFIGDLIDTVVVDVTELDVFDSSNFDIEIRSDANGETRVYGTLYGNYYLYYDIDCKVLVESDVHDDPDLDYISVKYENSSVNELNSYFSYVSGSKIYFNTTSSNSYFIEVFFRITNKSTGQVVYIKSIDFNFGNLGHGYNEEHIYEDDEAVENGDFIVDDGSSDIDFSGIENWKIEDYYDLVSADNFVWKFFKAVLFELPSWITTPLYILIFGVVIITLYRFIRGA